MVDGVHRSMVDGVHRSIVDGVLGSFLVGVRRSIIDGISVAFITCIGDVPIDLDSVVIGDVPIVRIRFSFGETVGVDNRVHSFKRVFIVA